MRVVLVGTGMRPIPPTGYGGVERSIAEYAQALRRAGDEVAVLNEVYPQRTGEYRFARRLAGLRPELERGIVHAHTPVVARRLAQLGIPYAYTTHSRHWFVRRGLTQRWGYRLEQRAVRHAQGTVALTGTVRDRILGSLGHPPPGPITTIPLGVDLDRFAPVQASGDPTIALGVGAVIPVKRWHLAARALDGTGIRLRLVGPTPDPAYVRAVRGSGPVDLLGERSEGELTSELRGAGYLVHPSRVELFPGVVAQAMAAGRPVIGASAIAPLVEEGRTALVIDEATEPAMALEFRAAIEGLRDDEARRVAMGQAGRALAERAFDWKRVVEAHRQFYASCGLARELPT